jgi:16S rRNA (uracil1498-N3)-methyltransferase
LYRAFISEDLDGRFHLPPEEKHHLVRVRRAKEGQKFLGFAEKGQWYLCQLIKTDQGWDCDVLELIDENRESPLNICLAQALIKKDKFEWVIQKSAELGVAEIIPVQSKRSELRLSVEREGRKMIRWDRILRETVKQCGRTCIPRLSQVKTLTEVLDSLSGGFQFFLDEREGLTLKSLLQTLPGGQSRCTVFVGPEGGWDDEERELFEQKKVPPIHLGPRIMRAETAPVAIISILQYAIGDFA